MSELTPRPGDYFIGYEHHEDVATGETSEAVYIPPLGSGGRFTVVLRAGANTGKIQWTADPAADVLADTATNWIDWSTFTDDALSTGTLIETIISPINGVRCVSIAGAVSFDIIT